MEALCRQKLLIIHRIFNYFNKTILEFIKIINYSFNYYKENNI